MPKLRTLALICCIFISSWTSGNTLTKGSSHGEAFIVEQIIDGLSVPWGMTFLSPDELIITQREGNLWRWNKHTKGLSPISGLPRMLIEGQGGLLDVANSPSYQDDSWLFFTYSKEHNQAGETALARAKLEGDQLVNWQELFVSETRSATSRHFGSRISFDEKGHIFFTVGDRGERDKAQQLNNHAGTVIRLHLDGKVPNDNPFIGTPGAKPEIWSYGHRNPQGISFDRSTQKLWLIEHGPRGGDEINLVQAGKNYGWPVISYGKEYWGPFAVGESTHKEGMEQPVKYYSPSIAPSSLAVYSGKAFKRWTGHLFAGALKLQHLNQIKLNDADQVASEERLLTDLNERIRNVIEVPEGHLYLATDSGRILRLKPKKP